MNKIDYSVFDKGILTRVHILLLVRMWGCTVEGMVVSPSEK